jgi:uncharacterized protein (TIGR00725 family)
MLKTIVGVMGPGVKASPVDLQNAYQLGELIAQQGWVLLTGGRNVGVMDAANQGAKAANGLTIGILPTAEPMEISEAVDIAILTDLGNARNNINVLSSQVVIACGMGAGTASEIALALKGNKKVILLNKNPESQQFFKHLSKDSIFIANCPRDAINIAQEIISQSR